MQRNLFTKTFVLLSVLGFLFTTAGNAFGYAWCFDDAGQARVELAAANGCADRDEECDPRKVSPFPGLSEADGEHCSPCSDFLIGNGDAVVSKRSAAVIKLPLMTDLPLPAISVPVTQNLQLQGMHTPLRVSRAILAHRTVVLLH